MNFNEKRILGRTGLQVSRLGISSSFRAPAKAFEEAFERGCNYFNWGTFIKGRSPEMLTAIRNITNNGKRDNLILGMYTYAHNSYLTEKFLAKGLKQLGLEYTDVLILGYYSRRPGKRLLESAYRLKEKGLIRFIALSGHNRKLFPKIQNDIDIFHVRYNAAHRGAETDTFPHLQKDNRPGIVTFTATCWGQLLDPKKIPKDEFVPTAIDCYRFVLSNPAVDLCMMGARNIEQMRNNLKILDHGPMSREELNRMIQIGDFVYGKKKN